MSDAIIHQALEVALRAIELAEKTLEAEKPTIVNHDDGTKPLRLADLDIDVDTASADAMFQKPQPWNGTDEPDGFEPLPAVDRIKGAHQTIKGYDSRVAQGTWENVSPYLYWCTDSMLPCPCHKFIAVSIVTSVDGEDEESLAYARPPWATHVYQAAEALDA